MVPEEDGMRARVLDEVHARKTTAHPGRNKTRSLIKTHYWWPGISIDSDKYVSNCLTCRASKVPRDKTPGFLHPLPVPERGWKDLAVDFKSTPKDKNRYDNLMVIVDRLSKATWATPCFVNATARDAAKMYYNGPFRIFQFPDTVVSDRGPQFVSDFTDELSKIMGVTWRLSTAGHSQTAGQVEILNQIVWMEF